ncbi:MAG: hypothetical protein V2B18_19385 [Pseudomonadota bacterium]
MAFIIIMGLAVVGVLVFIMLATGIGGDKLEFQRRRKAMETLSGPPKERVEALALELLFRGKGSGGNADRRAMEAELRRLPAETIQRDIIGEYLDGHPEDRGEVYARIAALRSDGNKS